MVALTILACGLGAMLYIKSNTPPPALKVSPALRMIKAGRKKASPALRRPKKGLELIAMPRKMGEPTETRPLRNWTITLTPGAGQTVSVESGKDAKNKKFTFFRIKSAKSEPLNISYFPVTAKKGMRFSGSAQIKKVRLDSGFIELRLMERMDDGSLKTILRREPKNIAKLARWIKTSVTNKTKEPLLDDGKLIWCLHCEFTGEILVRKARFARKE
jgi:hypothetical protein